MDMGSMDSMYSMGGGQMMGGAYGPSPMPPGGMVPPNIGMSSLYSIPGVGPRPPPKPPTNLSVTQMKLLSAQIKAYRYLARNMPLPDPIKSIVLSHASSNVSNQPVTMDTASSRASPTNSKLQGVAGGNQSTNQVEDVKGEEGKGGGKGDGTPTGKGQAQLKQVKLGPSNKPPGLDPDIILKEREARLGEREREKYIYIEHHDVHIHEAIYMPFSYNVS